MASINCLAAVSYTTKGIEGCFTCISAQLPYVSPRIGKNIVSFSYITSPLDTIYRYRKINMKEKQIIVVSIFSLSKVSFQIHAFLAT